MAAPLRAYQTRIIEKAVEANTIVLLPTGAGKTWIAAEAIVGIGAPAIFFVPTIPLVSQQAAALRSRPGMPLVGEYNGEVTFPHSFEVLVTTPKAFETAQARGVRSLAWESFKVVVFDEVHHVIKDHPYRNLALKLQQSGCNPRVIGLTASLTYSVGARKMKSSINKLCQELRIERIENASDEEIRDGGYQGAGRGVVAEVRLPVSSDFVALGRGPDVVPHRERKPHLRASFILSRKNHLITYWMPSLD